MIYIRLFSNFVQTTALQYSFDISPINFSRSLLPLNKSVVFILYQEFNF
jgi:hypothetical protein